MNKLGISILKNPVGTHSYIHNQQFQFHRCGFIGWNIWEEITKELAALTWCTIINHYVMHPR